MKKLIPLLFLLASCATQAPIKPTIPSIVPPKIVEVPVATSCVPKNLSKAPTYPDTKEALNKAPAADGRYQLLTAGWGMKNARLKTLEGVVDGCR